ncbi:class I SAM-dependent methyltransferase [Symbioplanes lichenis]|uniref:class I SAM-dependent methyltransferase n=1 Tax=Symbioplanes lichenis TaxID=1629072 RepID=UPI00273891CA|nr:class I SAM-dependent methyltransferase [Actinoplanes lichenis]
MANAKLGGELHRQRGTAENYGIDAERYDRTRPRYPEALVTRILQACPGAGLLDVGVGTGIEARQFQAAGGTVLGVEPDARMAEFARAQGTETEVARFEDWEPQGRRFDGVISGQAWHWVDAAVGAAKAASVLRPGGLLAPFWNVAETPEEVREAFRDIYVEVVPDALATRAYTMPNPPLNASPLLTRTVDGIRQAGVFGEPEQWEFAWDHVYDKDEWLDQLPTLGDHGQFPPEKLDRVVAGVGAAIDALGGSFTMKYTAVVVAATLPAA